MQVAVVSVLMVGIFHINLARLWGRTNPFTGQDINWQHSIFVPLIGLYYLYLHRDEMAKAAGAPVRREKQIRILALVGLVLLAAVLLWLLTQGPMEMLTHLLLVSVLAAGMVLCAVTPTSTVMGAVLMVDGLLVFGFGIFPGQNDYLKDLGMVITLFGVTTLLAGWAVMRVAWFPIVFLIVALPWPELVYSRIAWPLQKLAASAAVGTLRLFQVEAHNYGTRIIYMGVGADGPEPRMLNVAEACAGLKSVMTFLMVAGTVAFLSARPMWEKLTISLMAIPIAIFCNVVRVAGQGVLDRYWSHEVSQGFAHQFVGLVMVIPGFFIILMVGWILDRVFIEEVDPGKLRSTAANKRKVVEVRKRESAVAASVPAPQPSSTTTLSEPGVPVVTHAATAFDPPAVTGQVGAAVATNNLSPAEQVVRAQPASAPSKPLVKPNPVRSSNGEQAKPAVAATSPAAPSAPQPHKPATPAPSRTSPPAVAPARPAAASSVPTTPARAPSTLKQPAAQPSTLKPSAKPAAPRPGTLPGALKPSAPKPPVKPPVAAPASTLKPPARAPQAKPVPAVPIDRTSPPQEKR